MACLNWSLAACTCLPLMNCMWSAVDSLSGNSSTIVPQYCISLYGLQHGVQIPAPACLPALSEQPCLPLVAAMADVSSQQVPNGRAGGTMSEPPATMEGSEPISTSMSYHLPACNNHQMEGVAWQPSTSAMWRRTMYGWQVDNNVSWSQLINSIYHMYGMVYV